MTLQRFAAGLAVLAAIVAAAGFLGSQRLARLENRLSLFEQRAAALEGSSAGLAKRLKTLQGQIDSFRVVSDSLASRLGVLRGEVDEGLNTPVEPIVVASDAAAGRIDRLAAGLAELEREMEALSWAVNAVAARQGDASGSAGRDGAAGPDAVIAPAGDADAEDVRE